MDEPSEEPKQDLSLKEGFKQLFFTAVAAFGALVTVAAIVTLISYTGEDMDRKPSFCKTQTCIKEALGILHHIDVGVDPCKNFYRFACNNMPEYSTHYNDYNPSTVQMQKELLKLEKMYNEPITNNEHYLVKTQKIMYKACMNEIDIAENAFNTIKNILKKLGGWPVVEGADWSETTFDWKETVYQLRELGYFFPSFLQVTTVTDPKHEEDYIFEVSIPHIHDVYSKWFDCSNKNKFMADVAVVFGAEAHTALIQMNETYQFLQELRHKRNELAKHHDMFHKTTIEKLQQREASIDWLQFINKVVGPYTEVYEDEFVLFPSKRHLDAWLRLIDETPKRTLANYMMWKVVEEVLPYLTEDLDKGGVRPKLMSHIRGKSETRSRFCINEIRKRFVPNPMEIMYIRKYLPEKKRRKVDEIVRSMKTEFVRIAKGIKWLNSEDKQNAVNRLSDMRVMIGVPATYFDDVIFDNMILGRLSNIDDHNFLTLLSQANKHNLDWLYSLINKSTNETKIVRRNLLSNAVEYNVDKNEINIPATIAQDPIFNENRPNYLNYAHLGIALKDIFFQVLGKPHVWSNQSKVALEQKKECLIGAKNVKRTSTFDLMMDGLVANILAIKISYGAYKNWANNNQELSLIVLNYTSEQSFWMASGYMLCENTLSFPYANVGIQAAQAYSTAVYNVINNNFDVTHDFNCSASRVNFENTCKIF